MICRKWGYLRLWPNWYMLNIILTLWVFNAYIIMMMIVIISHLIDDNHLYHHSPLTSLVIHEQKGHCTFSSTVSQVPPTLISLTDAMSVGRAQIRDLLCCFFSHPHLCHAYTTDFSLCSAFFLLYCSKFPSSTWSLSPLTNSYYYYPPYHSFPILLSCLATAL